MPLAHRVVLGSAIVAALALSGCAFEPFAAKQTPTAVATPSRAALPTAVIISGPFPPTATAPAPDWPAAVNPRLTTALAAGDTPDARAALVGLAIDAVSADAGLDAAALRKQIQVLALKD